MVKSGNKCVDSQRKLSFIPVSKTSKNINSGMDSVEVVDEIICIDSETEVSQENVACNHVNKREVVSFGNAINLSKNKPVDFRANGVNSNGGSLFTGKVVPNKKMDAILKSSSMLASSSSSNLKYNDIRNSLREEIESKSNGSKNSLFDGEPTSNGSNDDTKSDSEDFGNRFSLSKKKGKSGFNQLENEGSTRNLILPLIETPADSRLDDISEEDEDFGNRLLLTKKRKSVGLIETVIKNNILPEYKTPSEAYNAKLSTVDSSSKHNNSKSKYSQLDVSPNKMEPLVSNSSSVIYSNFSTKDNYVTMPNTNDKTCSNRPESEGSVKNYLFPFFKTPAISKFGCNSTIVSNNSKSENSFKLSGSKFSNLTESPRKKLLNDEDICESEEITSRFILTKKQKNSVQNEANLKNIILPEYKTPNESDKTKTTNKLSSCKSSSKFNITDSKYSCLVTPPTSLFYSEDIDLGNDTALFGNKFSMIPKLSAVSNSNQKSVNAIRSIPTPSIIVDNIGKRINISTNKTAKSALPLRNVLDDDFEPDLVSKRSALKNESKCNSASRVGIKSFSGVVPSNSRKDNERERIIGDIEHDSVASILLCPPMKLNRNLGIKASSKQLEAVFQARPDIRPVSGVHPQFNTSVPSGSNLFSFYEKKSSDILNHHEDDDSSLSSDEENNGVYKDVDLNQLGRPQFEEDEVIQVIPSGRSGVSGGSKKKGFSRKFRKFRRSSKSSVGKRRSKKKLTKSNK